MRASRSQLALSSGADRDDLPEHLHAGAEIVALEGGVGLAPQRRGGLVTWPASVLIWASSLIAASARSSRSKAFWRQRGRTMVKDNSVTSAANEAGASEREHG